MPSELRLRLCYKVVTREFHLSESGHSARRGECKGTPDIQMRKRATHLWRGQDALLVLQAGTSTHARGTCLM